ncbi:cryptochrome/photolyase family protein [Rhizosaccharibacter radicis]|uniref:Cryptochrome/photolyase family protein n=1 Tax=Rhizosaccharibacter radicis TaxID=2782605 RepID=A0ABT1VXL8_9PROT|nr:cryptochrome/photolyase family protein [Acetobacteraceae bacterium KSS12]
MAGRTLRIVLGDQLSDDLSALDGAVPDDLVVMAEVRSECTYVRHHKKKLVLVLSAMRHFAARLREAGLTVRYVALDDPDNSHCLRGEVARAAATFRPDRVVATSPGEWRVLEDMRGWQAALGVPVEILDDERFLCGSRWFRHWVATRQELRMEFFYREMRRHHRLLMEHDAPAGGRWNFDRDNRKPMPAGIAPPVPPGFEPDDDTRAVMALVDRWFPDHWGDTAGFAFPVTAEQAALALDHFVAERLPSFGDWQDFMREGDPVLFHGLLSFSLNLGLLDPLATCRAVERAWREGLVPINAAEGFVRQIAGWREYVRGIYWLRMPEYGEVNALGADRALPWFYWSGETDMRCMARTIDDTRRNAYAHHIQRLMVTGNFALLAGLDPDAVDDWYMVVFADAYQWVEMPNVRGMALWADGGLMGSKPYAASGAYIHRMSDYCGRCRYDVRRAVGTDACPFNALYWDFLARNAERLRAVPRMAMPLGTLDRMPPPRLAALRARAAELLRALDAGERI